MCISPCAPSGASQEKALSMRSGVAGVVDQQVLRPQREAERHAGQRRASAWRPCRPAAGPAGSAAGRATCSARSPAYRSRRAASAAGGCARQVWKPLECAEMPRIACIATGPADHGLVPAAGPESVQGWSSTIGWSKATSAISAAMRRMVAAGMPQRSATASGAYSAVEVALGQQLEDRLRACGHPAGCSRRPSPAERPAAAGVHRAARAVPGQRRAVLVAREQPVIGAARDCGPPARPRWCSGRGSRDRPGRSAAAHAPAPARTARRCRGGCRSIHRRWRNSRCAPG